MIKYLGAGLLIAFVAMIGSYWFVCPCATVPGGALSGEVASALVSDWSFVNSKEDVPLCQVEVQALLPHSVNVNCMSSNSALYLSCSKCEGKYWSSLALEDSNGRVRAGLFVYPVTLSRVTEVSELDAAWQARAEKVGTTEVQDRPGHWWAFRLGSRPAG
jgi:hypothetical protein